MSSENVETVRAMFDAFLHGGFERSAGYLDPDIEWDGTNLPDGRVAHGREAVADHITRWAAQWHDWTLEPERVIDAGGDNVIAIIRERGRSEAGVEMDERHAELYALEGGRIVWRKGFSDPHEAFEAVGRREQ